MFSIRRNTSISFLSKNRIRVLNTIFGTKTFEISKDDHTKIIDLVKVKLYDRKFALKSEILDFMKDNNITFFGLIISDEDCHKIDTYVRNKSSDIDFVDSIDFSDKEKYFSVNCIEE